MENHGLRVGFNWYLVSDETHNADGKHIGYLENPIYNRCDDELKSKLQQIISNGKRSVEELEKLVLLDKGQYYHELLVEPSTAEIGYRNEWHNKALEILKTCDIVFLDLDNGVLPKSVSRGSKKSIKFVLEEEILDYYQQGQSVVFYNHRCREKADVYLKRFDNLFSDVRAENASKPGIYFVRGTIRDYIFLIQPEHREAVEDSIEILLSGAWGEHFKRLI